MLATVIISVLGTVLLYLGFLKSRWIALPFALFTLLAALVALFVGQDVFGDLIKTTMEFGKTQTALSAILIGASFFLAIFMGKSTSPRESHYADYLGLLLFVCVGGILMVSFKDFTMLFLGIEILSIALYILAGTERKNVLSNEASLKYFILGAFASAIFLYGVALYYGGTGSLKLDELPNGIMRSNAYVSLGILFIVIGLAFKIAIAPFHMWAPDVYQGAPTLVTATMATLVKVAGVGALYKLFISFRGIDDVLPIWLDMVLLGMIALTLLIGNITAVAQSNVKRMLAYSSIAHAGFLLMALQSNTENSARTIVFYLFSYVLSSIIAFVVLHIIKKRYAEDDYEELNGLSKTNGFLAMVMAIAMLSMAGIPFTGGFLGKFFVFSDAIESGKVMLVIFAAIMAAVGVYYYFKVINAMYFKVSNHDAFDVSNTFKITLGILALLIVIAGILPVLVFRVFGL